VYAALERRASDGSPSGGWRPEEKVGLEDAVRAYSAAAAAAAGVSGRRGTLAPGSDADLVAWEVDPAAERDDGHAFRAGRAVLTVVDGEVVMSL
jgi:predicted amidohydrolase YtcJ